MSIRKNKEIGNTIRTPKESLCIDSETLLSGKKEITIIHNDDEYKLRLTGNGKLILTK